MSSCPRPGLDRAIRRRRRRAPPRCRRQEEGAGGGDHAQGRARRTQGHHLAGRKPRQLTGPDAIPCGVSVLSTMSVVAIGGSTQGAAPPGSRARRSVGPPEVHGVRGRDRAAEHETDERPGASRTCSRPVGVRSTPVIQSGIRSPASEAGRRHRQAEIRPPVDQVAAGPADEDHPSHGCDQAGQCERQRRGPAPAASSRT